MVNHLNPGFFVLHPEINNQYWLQLNKILGKKNCFSNSVFCRFKRLMVCLLIFLLLITAHTFSNNFLPENRKGDWKKAGYLRFLKTDLKLYKVNNVLLYGAKNNGQDFNNNNYQSIMKAVTDCAPHKLTMIFFPAGIYKISSPITLKDVDNIVLRGEGSAKTKLIFNFNNSNNKTAIGIISSEKVGLENFYIEREDSTDFGDNISIQSKDCWISGIESYRANASHISIYNSKNIEIRGCTIHHAWNYGVGGHGYGIVLGTKAVRCLIEDNIFNHLRHSVILSNNASSNVIGYNYSTNPFTTETYLGISDWPSDLCLHGHPTPSLKGPDRNLFEGNICAFLHADDAWGANGPYNTFLRNRATYYGLKIYKESNSQNIIANEVDDSHGSLFDIFWNAFNIQSTDNYIMGNTNFDPNPDEYPSKEYYSSDLSLYFNPDSIPKFLDSLKFWPPIGVVDDNNTGGGTIPAKQRWDRNGILTVQHQNHDIIVKLSKFKKLYYNSYLQLIVQNSLYSNVKICYTIHFESQTLLSIYSVHGKLMTILKNHVMKPGSYEMTWNKRNKNGRGEKKDNIC